MLKGLWFCTCTYVWHAGGAGKLLSEWMGTGSRPDGAAPVDPARLFSACGTEAAWKDTAAVESAVADVYASRMSEHKTRPAPPGGRGNDK